MLVTFFLEYAGGTYLSQAVVEHVVEFPTALAATINWSAVSPAPAPAAVQTLVQSLAKSPPTAVSELQDVWCMSGLLHDELVLVHAIRTDGRWVT
jgi:hypothetical protein